MKFVRALKNKLHKVFSTTLIIASVVLVIGTINARQSMAATACSQTTISSVLANEETITGAKASSRASKQIRDAVENLNSSDSRRECELRETIKIATAVLDESICTGNKPPSRSQIAAVVALGSLKRPWASPDKNKTEKAVEKLYAQLQCLDSNHRELVRKPVKRKFRQAIELAIANVSDGFLDTLRFQSTKCSELDLKTKKANTLKDFKRAELAIKSVVVEASSLITSAQISLGCRTYEEALNAASETIESALSNGLAANSLEGWRWINDLQYNHAVYQLALGNSDKSLEIAKQLKEIEILSNFQGYYSNGVHPVAMSLLKTYDKQRKKSGQSLYSDQVFIAQPMPGYFGDGAHTLRRYYAMHDVSEALQKTIKQIKESPPQGFPCTGDCDAVIRWLDKTLTQNLIRTDLRVVAGSYLDRAGARRGMSSVCANISIKGKSCFFEIDRYGKHYRVATKPMTDEAASEIKNQLNSKKIQSFLSRPRVIEPL